MLKVGDQITIIIKTAEMIGFCDERGIITRDKVYTITRIGDIKLSPWIYKITDDRGINFGLLKEEVCLWQPTFEQSIKRAIMSGTISKGAKS